LALLYDQGIVGDDFGGFIGSLLLRACPTGGFGNGLGILGLRENRGRKKGPGQNR
jgi:hypothetical protein